MSTFDLEPLGEDALLLRLGDHIDPAVNRRVHALAARIAAASPPWLRELVPAYASLAVFVDLDLPCPPGIDPITVAMDGLRALVPTPDTAVPVAAEDDAPFDIPVCHAPDFAPDLDALAAHAGISREETIARHCAGDYRVAMVGFAPGFPYLLGLDPALAMPRLATPRTRVPAGSVAIGGAQAGLYPREGPGGWRLLGRTPLAVFDPVRVPPALLVPGRRVRFRAIDAATFARLARAPA